MRMVRSNVSFHHLLHVVALSMDPEGSAASSCSVLVRLPLLSHQELIVVHDKLRPITPSFDVGRLARFGGLRVPWFP